MELNCVIIYQYHNNSDGVCDSIGVCDSESDSDGDYGCGYNCDNDYV